MRPSLARRLGGAALSLLAVVALFAALEFGLRAAGIAEPPSSTLRYQQVYPPLLRPDELPDGRQVLATVDPRLPYQWIAPGDDVFRVAVFGGSAVAGLGSAPGATFARELETILRAAYPDTAVEVLNLGVVALASGQVLELVEDLAAHGELDLAVIYSGNNEFLELHSRVFAEHTGAAPGPLAAALRSSRLASLLRGGRREPSPEELERSVSTRNLAANDDRVEHSDMLAEVRIDAAQVTAVEQAYEDNLRAMVAACREAEVPAVVCTVATNWRWTGLEDEDDSLWRDELGLAGDALVAACVDRAARADDPVERWHWLDRAARTAEGGGQAARAAELFRSALDSDPHLRRATSRLAERARAVAASEAGAYLFDADAVLTALSTGGVIGFETFYDYVHFTPGGALTMARELARAAGAAGLLPGPYEAPRGELEQRLAFIEADGPDALAVRDFLGFGFDRTLLESRDLWRYDAMQDDLDARIDADPQDWRARCYRGNVAFFRPGGAADAERDYRAALAIQEQEAVRGNLERVTTDRRP
ncbi:hypothetical protein [Engelhardtia mirabilis]|uniref:SGNH hydrolase-type esterase domain-containing protein n=1 Tax=Engelhardtia mirabilis TaxID=2528011 RepID=A0A518BNX3_9BACT|nr:hypothetical protein Pla133_37880 [Planctomycetes bacterium Pla133]QDV03012.1 hypothetical protein Pla86_37870 [Planctomycetes bacterium Pla86]